MIEVSATGINALSRALAEAADVIDIEDVSAMRESTDLARDFIRARTPVRTGRLAGSWETSTTFEGDVVVGHVFTHTPYGGFVERGTRPHMIFPREKRALWWPGALHPVRKVRHPGFIGRHMARTGAVEAVPGIIDIFRSHVKRALSATFRLNRGVSAIGTIEIQ